MNHSLTFSRSTVSAAVAAAFVAAASGNAVAAGAVTVQGWDNGLGVAPSIGAGESLSVVKSMLESSYSDNPGLHFSAWGHTGAWYTFELAAAADTKVRLAPETAGVDFKPGLTVWASGSEQFDGGDSSPSVSENSDSVWSSPDTFNAVDPIGSRGTAWMSVGSGGLKETLAYGVSGESQLSPTTGWDEDILQGIHDVSVTNLYEQGVTGSMGGNWVELSFSQLQPGWYAIYAGGTDHNLTSQNMLLTVSAVPEPQTWAMLTAGLLLVPLLRRKRVKR
ncbi:MAG: hypothetical protein OEM00_07095 [Burkholderiaceae bacterium]|nr:hypothetical protein [Burkholderiaceae bacterium]